MEQIGYLTLDDDVSSRSAGNTGTRGQAEWRDALSSNHAGEAPTRISLCNAHSRRKFVDVKSHFPD